VSLNVTGHFIIARTRQQLLIQIKTTKTSQMSPSERHFNELTKQAIPRIRVISVFLLHKLTVLQKCAILSVFLFSVAQRPNSGRGCVTGEISLSNTHEHITGRSPPNDLSACCRGCYLHNTQQTHETNIHALSGIRSRNPITRPAADLRLKTARPPGSAVCISVTHNTNALREVTPCRRVNSS
jgi:hypothetical protein